VVFDWVWIHRGRWPKGVLGFLKTGLPRYMPYVVLVAIFLFIRTQVVGAVFLPTPPAEFDNPLPHLESVSRWLTTWVAIGIYVRLLVFPLWLMPDYSYGEVPIATSVLDPLVWGPIILVVGLGVLVIRWIVRRHFLSGVLGVLFFVVAFAPVSNIVVMIGTILGERLLYLPMVGVALCVGSVISRFMVGEERKYVAIGLVVLLGVLGGRTMVRNADWQNDVTLFLSAIHDGNRSAKVYYNLGVGYRKQGQYGEALKAFEKLAELKADDAGSWKYLGIVYAEQNRYVESANAYARAVALDSTQVDLWKRLGEMSVKSGNGVGAEAAFLHVLNVQADDVDARFELAKVYYRLGNMTGAIRQCEILLSEYAFDHKLATVFLGSLYMEAKRYVDAQMLIQSAYLRWPEDAQVQVLVGDLQKVEK